MPDSTMASYFTGPYSIWAYLDAWPWWGLMGLGLVLGFNLGSKVKGSELKARKQAYAEGVQVGARNPILRRDA